MLPRFLGHNFGKPLGKPPPLTPLPTTTVRVPPTVPAKEIPFLKMPVLVIYNRFIELILRGHKHIEMRSTDCSHVGKRIALGVSGAGSLREGFYVLGTAGVSHTTCRPQCPHKASEHWDTFVQAAACVGGTWPAAYPWLWHLEDVQAFDRPVRYIPASAKTGKPCAAGTIFRYAGRSWVEDA